MRKQLLFIATMMCGVLTALSGGVPRQQTVGLVLSGGGSKGIAHIGFIQAMEENHIPIDYITGTSMGAIVGALYSIGYSPAEMLGLLEKPEFMEWATGVTSSADRFYFNTPASTPEWVGVNLATSDSATMAGIFPTRLINPLPMSFAFMEMFSPATGACNGDFDRLMVPYRAIASDVYRHRKVVFSSGQLPLAVRASMSFPLVFQPIMIGDTLMYDGGLYDVYPVDVMMEDFNPDRVVGIDVSTPNTPPGLNDLVGQVENMVMTGYMAPFPDDRGVNVVFDLSKYGLTHWEAAAEIYRIGYARGMELADSLKRRIQARRTPAEVNAMRARFRERLRPTLIQSVGVKGTDNATGDYIRRTFVGHNGPVLDIGQARRGFYRVASTGRMRNLVPHAAYDSVTGMFDLDLHADVSKDFHIGVGGYVTSGSQSMLYMGMHYDALDFRRPFADLEGWGGANYLAASGRVGRLLPTDIPSRVWLRMSVSRERLTEREEMFYDFKSPAWNIESQITARAAWERAAGQHGMLHLSLAYGHLTSSYRLPLPDGEDTGRQRIIHDLGQARVEWKYSTLDNDYLPTTGSMCVATVDGMWGVRRMRIVDDRSSSHPGWVVGAVSGTRYFGMLPRFSLGARASALYSTQKLLDGYTASLVMAPAYAPFESARDVFNPAFRANGYVTAGLIPLWSPSELFQVRFDAGVFVPMRRILQADGGKARYGRWFGSCEFAGELSVGLKLPFGAVRAYCHYTTTAYERWGGGISLGLLIKAPRFMR